MKNPKSVKVFINDERVEFDCRNQTGSSIKETVSIPLGHLLTKGKNDPRPVEACQDDLVLPRRHKLIRNNDEVILKNGQRFWSFEDPRGVTVSINRVDYFFRDSCQTGTVLKERAGIEQMDVLFLDKPCEDEVIPDSVEIKLRCGDEFYSSPPANYGNAAISPELVGCENFDCIEQPGGWTFLLVPEFPVPDGYSKQNVELLIKLPPGFPDAAPDMFWVSPDLRTTKGTAPQATSAENLLGKSWQRFSWHLKPGAWRPGISTLRDFMRCVRSRFECKD